MGTELGMGVWTRLILFLVYPQINPYVGIGEIIVLSIRTPGQGQK